MNTSSSKVVIGLCVLSTLLAVNSTRAAAQWRFPGGERIVAVADIHGAYSAFEKVLQQAGVVDASLQWTGGRTQLVIVGDVLDRGPDSRQAMDLIMRLEAEAPVDGGRVHMILGNHELMVLTGDLRYVSAEEFAAFADEESAESRQTGFRRFLEMREENLDETSARAEFDLEFPPGFFGHRAAFASNGVYGAWLLDRPLMVLMGDTAFVHGGLSEAVIELGAEGVNTELVQNVRDYVRLVEQFTAGGVLGATDSFYDHPALLDSHAARVASNEAVWPEGLEASVGRLRELNYSLVFGPDGPAWYRGTVGCSALIEHDRLTAALDVLGTERVVIGHTPTADSRVLSRMDQTVLRIDTGMLSEYYGGRAAALIVDGPEVSVIYEDERVAVEPAAQPRRVGLRPAGMTAEDLESFLSEAEVTAQVDVDRTTKQVRLRNGGLELDAVFLQVGRSNFMPGVAAYRLDRLLGLDMVPVAVVRELDGKLGSLQFSPARTITEPDRSARGIGGSAWCPLRDQFQSMYIFDALIFNEGRTQERMHYSLDNFQMILVGHDEAFSTRRGRPAQLQQVSLELTSTWQQALGSLNEELLAKELGNVLDERRISALLQRRDELGRPPRRANELGSNIR